jgi:hypothetical protein
LSARTSGQHNSFKSRCSNGGLREGR